MKPKLHKKSNSEKNLSLFSSRDYLHPSIDPFSNMRLIKKTIPILRPICHKRVISEDFSSKDFIKPSIDSPQPFNLLSPRFSPKSFLCLNPNFKKLEHHRVHKMPELRSSKIVKKKFESQGITCRHGGSTCTNQSKPRLTFNKSKARLEKLTAKPDLDFSFGN